LLLDKKLSKQTNKVLFVKIENDGYDLGAQRREIDKNDLPNATAIVLAFKQMLNKEITENEMTKLMENTKLGVLVEREIILANKEVALSAERYLQNDVVYLGKHKTVDLFTVCEFKRGTSITKKDVTDGDIPVIGGGQQPSYYHNQSNRKSNTITVSSSGAYAGFVNFYPYPIFASDCFTIEPKDLTLLDVKYLFHFIKSRQKEIYGFQVGGAQPHVYPKNFVDFQIPLPPIEVQQAIVAEIESYQKIIDGARQVVENYKPMLIPKNDWGKYTIRELCENIQYGLSEKLNTNKDGYKTFRMQEMKDGILFDNGKMKYSDIDKKSFLKYKLGVGDVLFNRTNSIEHVGRTGIFILEGEYAFASYLIRLKIKIEIIIPRFLNYIMNTPEFQTGIKQFATRAVGQANINAQSLGNYEVYIPSLKIQKEYVEQFENELSLVAANKSLIEMFEGKIKEKISEVWGE
jgi:type I restriction enzyme M protein